MIDCATYAETLMEAAREHATCAFAGLLSNVPTGIELRTAAIHAGATVELLTKALVWEISPLLVLQIEQAPHRDAFVAKRGVLDDLDLDAVHTVKAYEALRLATLAAGLTPADAKEIPRETNLGRRILSARNQALHMATTPRDPGGLADILAQFLRAFLPQRFHFGPTEEESQFLFGGPTHRPLRHSFLADDELTVRVNARYGPVWAELQAKIEKAKETFEHIRQQMEKKCSEEEIVQKLQEKAQKYAEKMDSEEPVVRPSHLQICPACSFQAVVGTYVTDVEMDEDGLYDVTYEDYLNCGCCDLSLNSSELSESRKHNPVPQTAMYEIDYGDIETTVPDKSIIG